MALPPGAVIGGYRIERVLGSGGMGAVYLGQHPSLPRQDAIKVLNQELSGDPEFRARFEREGSLAAGLDHPNIVPVYNRGEEHGLLWIAMKFVPGTDASEEAQKGPAIMTPPRALRIISEVGKGLDYAHRRRLLHRDVKPANFLLSDSPDDDEERVLLTDFGVAKSVEDGQDLTATGKLMATIAYASPEQLLGQHIDYRSDIYSLGCSFFRLLTGQNPYPSTVPAMVMMGHLNEAPPQISAVRRDLPPALDHVFTRVLAKNPAHRYSSCRDFVADAEAALYGRNQFISPDSNFHTTSPGLPATHTGQALRTASAVTQRDHQASIITQPREGFGHSAPPIGNGGARRRKLLVMAAAAVVAVLAIAAGIYATIGDGSGSSNGPDLAQVRSQHPEFANKTVAVYNYGNSLFSAALDGSPQANFLRDIGFRYTDAYLPLKNEKSPRELTTSGFTVPKLLDLVIIGRTDSAAGNGGLNGLPNSFLNSSSKIVVVDNITTVQALQVWTDQSPEILANELVPAISKVI